jgi:hypothetical protein
MTPRIGRRPRLHLVVIVGLYLVLTGSSGVWQTVSEYGFSVDLMVYLFIAAFGVLLVVSSRTGSRTWKKLRSRT